MIVMTQPATQELVKLLKQDGKTIENNIQSMITELDKMKTGSVRMTNDLSEGTLYAVVSTAEYARTNVICDVYNYNTKAWSKSVLGDITRGSELWWGQFNLYYCEPIYMPNMYFTVNGYQVPCWAYTDKLVKIAEGNYTWHWHLDSCYTDNAGVVHRVVQTPNNIMECEIISVSAWEVVI